MDNTIASGKKENKAKLFLFLDYAVFAVLLLTLIFYWLGVPFFQNQKVLIVISIIATFTVFISAIKSLFKFKISVDLLASVALIVSLLDKEWAGAIFINLMIVVARISLDYVKIKSHSALASLAKKKPEKAKIMENGVAKEIHIHDIKKGDRVIIELGESVPIDGVIESGEATIDLSALTGESMPVFKKSGDKILSFSTVVSGELVIIAEKVGKETTFEKIIELVEKSQENKAPIYTLISKFANWYIVLTLAVSVILYFWVHNLPLVVSFLLVSCADDIAVATPVALMSATSHAARHGAVIKGGDYLEALSHLKIIVFDKTGTLTKGHLKIENIFSFAGHNDKEVLEKAGSVCYFSTHPIAQTILHLAKQKNISFSPSENFQELGGRGMAANLNGKKIIVGKFAFFEEENIPILQKEMEIIKSETAKGYNCTLVGYGGKLIGFITLTDELRPKIKETLQELKSLGVQKTVMLTGDNEKIAQKTAEMLGIDEFHANLLPKDKVGYLEKYLSPKYKVAMVGDGVNDSPTLALSDVGIAMGAIGSDSAIESADIAMMKDDLSQLPELIKIGKKTMQVIRQNLKMWGVINILGFILVFLHILNPPGAAAWNFVTDFFPIINSLRLFK